MSTTETEVFTLENALDEANPTKVAAALQKVKLGSMLALVGATVVARTAGTTITLDPPALGPQFVTCSLGTQATGAAATGGRTVVPVIAGAAADATHATLSDDGVTLTFENTVSDAVVKYMPAPNASMSGAFEDSNGR